DLDEQWPRALQRGGDDAARRRYVVLREERASRIRDLGQAAIAHLEDADLLGRSEAVLRGTEQADRRVAVALERQHGVDQVLERLRAGDRAVFRDVSNEHDGNAIGLRQLHQPEGRTADLADASRWA